MKFTKPHLIGRRREMAMLSEILDEAAKGNGSSVIVSGEAGIGKSRLIDEFKIHAAAHFSIHSGAAAQNSAQPFKLISEALAQVIEAPLFKSEEYKSFKAVFAINRAGILVAHASSETEDLDGDIFAGMLTAVQAFVSSSIDSTGTSHADIGRLEYGDLKIILEHTPGIFVAAIFSGKENESMKNAIRQTVNRINNQYSKILESWNGLMEDVRPIAKMISELAEEKFLVRRDLENLKLEEERLKIADRVLELIASQASSGPLLLVLEDLHWADESSLSVFEYLARNIRNRRIMILATTRPVEEGPYDKILENVIDHGGKIIPLVGLENNALHQMLEDIYPGNSFPEEFTDQIIEHSGGNPFFFLELLTQLRVDGNVISSDGGFRLVGQSISVPASIEGIIHKRLTGLDPEAMALAEYMSCIGKTFGREEAMSFPGARDPEVIIGKLIENGIIMANNGTAEFSHAIFRDVIYSGISDSWKSSYHKNIGEYYESAFESKSEVIYQLARHFLRSREYRKAHLYCIEAGGKAETAFAAELALAFYMDALSLVPSLNDAILASEAGKSLPLRIGTLLAFTGQYDSALENYESILPKLSETREKAGILRRIAEIHYRRGDYEKSRKACESGLEFLTGLNSSEAEKLYSTLAWIFIRTGKHAMAIEILDKGLEAATACGDEEGIANVEHNIGSVMLHRGEYQQAIIHFNKALAIREVLNDVWHMSSTLNNLGNSHMGLGDLTKSLELYEKSVENSRKIGDNWALSISLTNMGNIQACLGDLNKSMEYYLQSYDLKVKFDDKWGLSTILENIGTLNFSFGKMEDALESYRKSLAIREKINDIAGISLSHINIGEAYHFDGRYEEAHTHYNKALEIAERVGEKWLVIVSNYRMAENLLAVGKIPEALQLANEALSISVETSSKSEEARSRQALGNIHAAEGNFELADAEFARARAIFGETLEKGETAKLTYDYALLHMAMDKPDIAREELQEAIRLFGEVGAVFFADKCRKKLDEII